MGRPYLGGRKAFRLRRKKAGLCVDCGKMAIPTRVRCCHCANKRNASHSARHKILKHEVFMAYGGYRCSCLGCHETRTEFLHIDHTNGDGAVHRRAIGDPTGANMYNWLRKNGFPKGFRVLCANCNWSYGRYGYCPHQKELDPDQPIHVMHMDAKNVGDIRR